MGPSGFKSRPAKVDLPAGSESCVVQGRPWLRSVDSERMGRVIEPRKGGVAGADAVAGAEGNTAAPRSRAVCPKGSDAAVPPGS